MVHTEPIQLAAKTTMRCRLKTNIKGLIES